MGRPRRIVEPVVAGATGTRTEAESPPALALVPEAEHTSPQRTSARQQLADAIATVAALEAEIAEAQAAVTEAEEANWRAFAVLRDAEETLEEAKPRPFGGGLKRREPYTFASSEEAEAYNAKLNEPPPSIEDAKAAVARATDARDSAVAALQFQNRRLDAAQGKIRWRRSNINDALRLAVHYDPATAALAAETKRLVTAAAAARRAFDMAVGSSFLPSDHHFYGTTDPTNPRADPEGWAILQRWSEALEALKTDPDAPLPMSQTT